MIYLNKISGFLKRLALLLPLACAVMMPGTAFAAVEETFDVLQIGTTTYRNVTVTTKARNYIFIMHSTGMGNFRIAELPPELRQKLGYGDAPEKTKVRGAAALSNLANQSISKMGLPNLRQLGEKWRAHGPASLATITLTPKLTLAAASGLALIFLLVSFCGMLICQKAGKPPGPLVWVPVLQLIPLLRAANMSPAWLLAFFVPVLNVVAHILWSFKIAEARGKSGWVGFFLVLPVTSLFAFLYLALSNGASKKEERTVEIMTLEAA